MNACIGLPWPAARPLEIGFRAAWDRCSALWTLHRRWRRSARPATARAFCPRCPAWSELETGMLTEPVPYLCEIARARKRLLRPTCLTSPPTFPTCSVDGQPDKSCLRGDSNRELDLLTR